MNISDKLYEVTIPFENDKEDCYFSVSPTTGKTLEDVIKEVLKEEVGSGKYVVEERVYCVEGSRFRGNVFAAWIESNNQLNYDIFPCIN